MSESNKKINVIMSEGMSNTTPQASLHWVDEFFSRSELSSVIDEAIGARTSRGAKDSDHIKAMVLSQICGGDTIENQKNLPARAGILGITIPSVSATRDYMRVFHNAEEDEQRGAGHCFIPNENKHLSGFARIHKHLLSIAHRLRPLETITLDQDATLIPTSRSEALFNYRGERSYEAFNTYCPEYDLMVGTQYRDGNVNAGYEQLDELKRILASLPEGVKKVSFRSDSAGYQTELMKYCASGKDERFGVIDFGISCRVADEFKEAVKKVPESEWRLLRREDNKGFRQEWAEVAYAPSSLSSSKKAPEIRFFATREVFRQRVSGDKLREESSRQRELQLPMSQTIIDELESRDEGVKRIHLTLMSDKIYKTFGVASNIMDKPGGEIIRWHRGRCGKSEQAHDILKNDFGGGHVPSYLFGVNAAWWNIAVLAMNVNSLLKRFFLPEGYENSRMKTLRNAFYTLAGKVVHHARRTVLKIWSGDNGAKLLMYALSRLDMLMPCAT
jgi:hypothetical protein